MLGFLVAATTLAAPTLWYGPAVASFPVHFTGNPYDPEQNDVRVRFTPSKGDPVERLAYFDSEASCWKAVLVSQQPGTFSAKLIRNGAEQSIQPTEGLLEVKQTLPMGGYVRIDSQDPRRFRLDSGEPYIPLGVNIGWGAAGITAAQYLIKFGAAKANWSRVWACHWDGKNPWWPDPKERVGAGQLSANALDQWQTVVEAAEAANIRFQFVLFHHGAFSSRVNPNWPDHPWNAKNGGFLKDAADFFTDAEAKRRAKLWLRYAVARYGHSPAVMAWELFNEVEWVDARYAERWSDIEAWHKEMATYLREIDPIKRLVTSSSELRSELNASLDYLQPHTYPPNLTAALASTTAPPAKPLFYGEFGPGGQQPARQAIRDGIYSALMAGHSGPGQYWFWDIVEKENLYSEFTAAAEVLAQSEWELNPKATLRWPTITTEKRGRLIFRPGKGFEKSFLPQFELPLDGSASAMSRLSSYVQGPASSLSAGPIRFRIRTARATEFRAHLSQVAARGAKFTIKLNGAVVSSREFPAAPEDRRMNEILKVPVPAGNHLVEIANEGPDWFVLDRYEVDDIGSRGSALARSDGLWAMVRLTTEDSGWVELEGLGLPDGERLVKVIDLATGKATQATMAIRGGKLRWTPTHPDVLLVFTTTKSG